MNMLKTIILTGTAVAMLALSPVPANAGKCKKAIYGYAKAVGLANAKAAAKASWKKRAVDAYGPAYIKPKFKNMKCSTYDASLFLEQCTFKAKACPVNEKFFKAPVEALTYKP